MTDDNKPQPTVALVDDLVNNVRERISQLPDQLQVAALNTVSWRIRQLTDAPEDKLP